MKHLLSIITIILTMSTSSFAYLTPPGALIPDGSGGYTLSGNLSISGDLDVSGSLESSPSFENTVIVAKSGGEYDSIQDAIDSVTDATEDKPYTIMIYPGVYEENLTCKNYVNLWGVGGREAVKVRGTSGTLVTLPDTFINVDWLTFEMEPTSSSDIMIDATAGAGVTGEYRIDNSNFYLNSDAIGIKPIAITANAGVGLYLRNADVRYNLTDTTATGIWGAIDLQSGNNSFYFLRSIAISTIGSGAGASFATVRDLSSGTCLFSITTVSVITTNSSYNGIAVPFASYMVGGVKKQISDSALNAIGTGGTAGTGFAIYLDTTTNDGILYVKGNNYTVSGYATNYRYDIGTGDTVRSIFNQDYSDLEDNILSGGILTKLDYCQIDDSFELLSNFHIASDVDKFELGVDGDFELYHDGTDSYLYNNTGDLYFRDPNANSGTAITLTEVLAPLSAGYITSAGVTYENLDTNGDVGIGADQVAAGDHDHDDVYYTETELDAGQLDNRYYTETELDAGQLNTIYYTETETDSLLSGKEDAFSKNTAFNKNFGSTTGTVCEGDDPRLSDPITSSTDNALVRVDTSNALQDTGILIDDSDNITGVNALTINSNLLITKTGGLGMRQKDTDSAGADARGYFELVDSADATRWRIGSVSDGNLLVQASAGNLLLGDSSGTSITSNGGDVTIGNGDLTVTSGNLTLSAGNTYFNGGNVAVGNGVIIGSHDDITSDSAGVAASVSTETTWVSTDGDSNEDNVTLANGTEGQTKYIACVAEGTAADTWRITPANLVGGTYISFDGVGTSVTLKMYSAGWVVVGGNGLTIN